MIEFEAKDTLNLPKTLSGGALEEELQRMLAIWCINSDMDNTIPDQELKDLLAVALEGYADARIDGDGSRLIIPVPVPPNERIQLVYIYIRIDFKLKPRYWSIII